MKKSGLKSLGFKEFMLNEGLLKEGLTRFLGKIGEELATNTISRLNLLADLTAELEGLLMRLNKVEEELSRVFSQVIIDSIRRATPGCIDVGFMSERLRKILPEGVSIGYRMSDRHVIDFLYFLTFLDVMAGLGYDTVTNERNKRTFRVNLQVRVPSMEFRNLDEALESYLPTLHIRKGSSSMAVFFKPLLQVGHGVLPTLQVYKGSVRVRKYVTGAESRPDINKVIAGLSIVNDEKEFSYVEIKQFGSRYYVDVVSKGLQPLYTLCVIGPEERYIVEKLLGIVKSGRKRIIMVNNERITPWELRRAKELMIRDIRSLAVQSNS